MRLYFRLLAAALRARMQYKFDFVLSAVLYGMGTALDFLFVATVLYHYKVISGWNLYEVALLSGVATSAFGIYRVFAAEIDHFDRYLIHGEFDSVLIRPWPTLATVIAHDFDLGRIGALAQGLLVLGIGLVGVLRQGAPAWVAGYIFLLPLAGACVLTALAVASSAAGFWLTRVGELLTFTISAPTAAGQYPADIFPRWLRELLTFVLPVTTFTYLPLRAALGKGGSLSLLLLPFLVAPVALYLSTRFWGWGERHYQSTGS